MPLFRFNGATAASFRQAMHRSRDPTTGTRGHGDRGTITAVGEGKIGLGITKRFSGTTSHPTSNCRATGQGLARIAIERQQRADQFGRCRMSVLYGASPSIRWRPCSRASRIRLVRTEYVWDVRGGRKCLEGRILARQREPEGPFGSFPVRLRRPQLSGGRDRPRLALQKDRSMRLSISALPWTEMDLYVCGQHLRATYVTTKKDIRRSSQSARSFTLGFHRHRLNQTQVWRFSPRRWGCA